MRTSEEIIREDEERRAKAGRYLDRMANTMEAEQAFQLEVEKIMADMRVRRAGYRHAHNAATRTLSDAQFDENVRREENGDPRPW
jgi:hypothetical protein